MNLIGDPWIPVVWTETDRDISDSTMVGLRELFRRCAEIRDLALGPPQRIAVMRLLLCIVHAALDGPEDEEDWKACRDRIVPEALRYLEDRVDKFELFGAQPFLQVAALTPTDNATVDKLDFGLASGNNATLFDQGGNPEGRTRPPSWIALHLLSFQCFSPGGRIGESTWAGKKTRGESKDAPCLETKPLLTLLRGANLLTAVHLNLPTKEMLGRQPFGQPVWDRPPPAQKGKIAEEIGQSYLGRLVPLSRAILLNRDCRRMTLANGLSYPKFPEVRDPMATVVRRGTGKNEKLAYLPINLAKHPWRELNSILAVHHAQDQGRAYALEHLQHAQQESIDLWVGGLAADRAKLLDSAEWSFALPAGLLYETCMDLYTQGVNSANRGEQALRDAVKEYSRRLKLESTLFAPSAVAIYWSQLDAQCGLLIQLASHEQDPQPWRQLCRRAMHHAYAQVCPHITPRQIQAFAFGRRRLRWRDATATPAEGAPT